MKFLNALTLLTFFASLNTQAGVLELHSTKATGGYEKVLARGKITSIEVDKYDDQSYLRIKSKTSQGPRKVTAEIQCKISEKAARSLLGLSLKELLTLLNQSLLSESNSSDNQVVLTCDNGEIVNLLNNKFSEVLALEAETIDIKTVLSGADTPANAMSINYDLVNSLSK